MNKILVTVHVLSTNEKYDMYIPIGVKVINLIDLIQKNIYELDDHNYVVRDPSEIILLNSSGNVINSNNIVKFSGLRNGSIVIMK